MTAFIDYPAKFPTDGLITLHYYIATTGRKGRGSRGLKLNFPSLQGGSDRTGSPGLEQLQLTALSAVALSIEGIAKINVFKKF